jgi:hypothetical protein
VELVLAAPILIGWDGALHYERRDVETVLDVVEPDDSVGKHGDDPKATAKVTPRMKLPLDGLPCDPGEEGANFIATGFEARLDPALQILPVDRSLLHARPTGCPSAAAEGRPLKLLVRKPTCC